MYKVIHICSQLRNLCGLCKYRGTWDLRIFPMCHISLSNTRSLRCKIFQAEEIRSPSFNFLCNIPTGHLTIYQFVTPYQMDSMATNMWKTVCSCTPLNLGICRIFEITVEEVRSLIRYTWFWEETQSNTMTRDSYMIDFWQVSKEAKLL